MIDGILLLWFTLTIPAALFVGWDLWRHTPEMGVMQPAWVLVTLYTGPLGLFVYLLSCREPLPGTPAQFVAPQWKQAVGSTVHCVAGDALGIIIAAMVTGLLQLPMWFDLIVEYAAGFAVGLFIFQSLFMKDMMGLTYRQALGRTWLPEFLSMNAMAAGIFPTMVLLMSRDMRAMEPTSLYFWGAMSAGVIIGAAVAYPVNWWLVARGLKHGMGTQRALGPGGHSLAVERTLMARRTGEQPQPRGALAQAGPPGGMEMPL